MFHADLKFCMEIIDVPIQFFNCIINAKNIFAKSIFAFGNVSAYERQLSSLAFMAWIKGLVILQKFVKSLKIML